MIPKFAVFAAETSVDAHIFPVQYRCTYPYIYEYIYIYQLTCPVYLYIYVCVCGTPKKTDVFEVATLLGQNTLFSLSFSAGYYIYMYTYVCINCCLTVEPRYLERFCHQKRLQTFANESRGPSTQTGLGFKIQDPKKLLESRGQDQESFWIQEVFFES